MALGSSTGGLLFFICLCGICTGGVLDGCKDYRLQFERVFSVPGDMAMLNSTLVSIDVFNFTAIPYNITWYDSKTSQEMRNQTGRILIREETLWFLNVTLDDEGEYVTILRTPSRCYSQATKLVVDLPFSKCGRPRNVSLTLTGGVTDHLQCPLKAYINKLNSYNISPSLKWYMNCEPINDEQAGMYTFRDTELRIREVEAQHTGSYTCTLKFTLGGITGSVSETIDAFVTNKFSLAPQVHEPANETIKAQMGSNFTKRCLVFVPGTEIPTVDLVWLVRKSIISNHPSDRIYTSKQRMWTQTHPIEGVWLEQLLMFTELTESDFQTNYTCRAYSYRGHPEAYFTLLAADPNILLPIGSVLVGVMVLFIISVTVYYNFKIDIVLWLRTTFPVLYVNKDLDGRLYDAYVAYAEPFEVGFSEEVEKFALYTLPQVLENACGYKLFIAGRDCLPGHAIIDSVEENIQASRRFLLLYTASTFTSKRHTSSTSSHNNNNISKNGHYSGNKESKTNDNSYTSFDSRDEEYPDTRQQFECMAAMHRALLEGSLKVILVELEEISPAQLALFPESVRHLRKKQGAVCWWKNPKKKQSERTYFRSRGDKEKCEQATWLSPSLSPASRFWKEMRYHMPVKGKRLVYAEKTALLNV